MDLESECFLFRLFVLCCWTDPEKDATARGWFGRVGKEADLLDGEIVILDGIDDIPDADGAEAIPVELEDLEIAGSRR